MHRINKKNNSYVIAAASVATLLTFAIVAAAVSNIANTIIPASATTTTTTTTSNDTTTATSPSEIDLSPEPVHQEQQTLVSENPINQTHTQFTFSGNGTEPISITSTGSVIAAMDGTAVGEEVLTTEDGTESATAKFYSIGRFKM